MDIWVKATRPLFAPHLSTYTVWFFFGHTSIFKRLSPLNDVEQSPLVGKSSGWKSRKKGNSFWSSATINQFYHFQTYCGTVNNPVLPGSQHYTSRDKDEELIQPLFLGKRFK